MKYIGVQEDTRPEEKKVKDIKFNEYEVGLGAVQFLPINMDSISHPAFKIVKAQGATTCGQHTIANMLQVFEYQETGYNEPLSAAFPYHKKAGKYIGSSAFDIMETLRKHGTTYEVLMPSNGFPDQDIEKSVIQITDTAIGNVLACNTTFTIDSFDEVVKYMENGRVRGVCAPVALIFRSSWEDYNKPVIKNTKGKDIVEVNHWFTAIAYGSVDGVNGLVIADSFAQGSTKNGFRFLERSAYDAFVSFAVGASNRKNIPDGSVKPEVTFDAPLKFGQRNNAVKQMQEFLKWAGYFPSDMQTTDFYGNASRAAVKAFQKTFVPPENMDDGNTFGNLSIKKMNEMLWK